VNDGLPGRGIAASQQLPGIFASLRPAESALLAMFAIVVKDFRARVALEDENEDEQ
jgi:hypothetical protein